MVLGRSEHAFAAEGKMSSGVSVPCQEQSELHAAKQAVDDLAAQVATMADQKVLELVEVQMVALAQSVLR